MNTASFENFPWRMVAACNAVVLGIDAAGIYVMASLGIVWVLLYIAYCLWMEWRLLSGSCRHCYYYGRRCRFGRGVICSWLFTKAAQDLGARCISWRNLAPDFLVSLVPLGVGIAMLLWSFSWSILLATLILLGLASVGTALIRGQIACKYCRQRQLGCPAERFFSRAKPA